MCGEYSSGSLPPFSIFGSSPRVWGIRDHPERQYTAQRFIPTCVGNTCWCRANPSQVDGSSPRVWGILVNADPTLMAKTGSSPRVWGILSQLAAESEAHAVHPHVCGEYLSPDGIKPSTITVHPHVCGEYVGMMQPLCFYNRFIPTCVGNTRSSIVG